MKTVVVRYRRRGSSDPWCEITLSLEASETSVERASRFEDENFGALEILPFEPSLRLVHSRKS